MTNKSKKWANSRGYPIGPVCTKEKGPGQGTGAVHPRPALQRDDNGANISGKVRTLVGNLGLTLRQGAR